MFYYERYEEVYAQDSVASLNRIECARVCKKGQSFASGFGIVGAYLVFVATPSESKFISYLGLVDNVR